MTVAAEDSGPAAVDELERLRRSIDRAAVNEAFDRVRGASYTGRDPDHLASVVIGGDGVVVRIRLGATATMRPAEQVERAVLAAIGAAQAELGRATQEITAWIEQQTAQLEAATQRYERTVLAPLRTQATAMQAQLRSAIRELSYGRY
jgi:hypothetical protein